MLAKSLAVVGLSLFACVCVWKRDIRTVLNVERGAMNLSVWCDDDETFLKKNLSSRAVAIQTKKRKLILRFHCVGYSSLISINHLLKLKHYFEANPEEAGLISSPRQQKFFVKLFPTLFFDSNKTSAQVKCWQIEILDRFIWTVKMYQFLSYLRCML